ncbi:hypothetical protein FHS18_004387 [Paenibacillus phyllosphaerae]|uniref:SLH domain-containing protein n=1 Tax=Paenibacillus phyllosphaerae TaxID=274593 RepID=A0A7W5FPF1_9BACL|nr:hypothetical protein [Paenibacillus phyllosphaerae]MBB3112301.1 hypothetical protein [Paenibacillus phyllosphaerae]
MAHSFLRSKKALAATLSLSLLAAIPAPALAAAAPAAVAAQANQSTAAASTENYALFLSSKLGITFGTAPTRGAFIIAIAQALQLTSDSADAVAFTDLASSSPVAPAASALYNKGIIQSKSVLAEQRLSALQAVFLAVKAAELKELAYTYPADKVAAALKRAKLTATQLGSLTAAQEIAAAIDTGLVEPADYGQLTPGAPASAGFAAKLLGRVLETQGLYKHYIGETSDFDIYAKLTDAYRTSDIIDGGELESVVDGALQQGLVTGYNLKDSRYDANFVDSLAITYGHSDLKHAIQLIGLLRSEGIHAKVQFEPKTSAFVHLIEWGEPEPSSDYQYKKLDNGNYIASAKEYDIAFEFDSAADKARFQPVILQYAKKNSEDVQGLISGSWWQPLYYSNTELADYDIITNNKLIGSGSVYAQSFSLTKDAEAVSEGFKKLNPDAKIVSYNFWVDHPFHNYLTGESHL